MKLLNALIGLIAILVGSAAYAREFKIEKSVFHQLGTIEKDSSIDISVMGNDRFVLNYNRAGQKEQVALLNDKGEMILETTPTYFTVYGFNQERLVVQTQFKLSIYNKNGSILKEIAAKENIKFHQLYVLENNYMIGVNSNAGSEFDDKLAIFDNNGDLVKENIIFRRAAFGDYHVVMDADGKSFVLVSQNYNMQGEEGKIYRISLEGVILSEATIKYSLHNVAPVVMSNHNIFLTADNTRDCGGIFPLTEKYFLYKVDGNEANDIFTIKKGDLRLVHKFKNENFLLYGEDKSWKRYVYFFNNEGEKINEFEIEDDPAKVMEDSKDNVNLFLAYGNKAIVKVSSKTGKIVEKITGYKSVYVQADGKFVLQLDSHDNSGKVYDMDFNELGIVNLSEIKNGYDFGLLKFKNGRIDMQKNSETNVTTIYYSELK